MRRRFLVSLRSVRLGAWRSLANGNGVDSTKSLSNPRYGQLLDRLPWKVPRAGVVTVERARERRACSLQRFGGSKLIPSPVLLARLFLKFRMICSFREREDFSTLRFCPLESSRLKFSKARESSCKSNEDDIVRGHTEAQFTLHSFCLYSSTLDISCFFSRRRRRFFIFFIFPSSLRPQDVLICRLNDSIDGKETCSLSTFGGWRYLAYLICRRSLFPTGWKVINSEAYFVIFCGFDFDRVSIHRDAHLSGCQVPSRRSLLEWMTRSAASFVSFQ